MNRREFMNMAVLSAAGLLTGGVTAAPQSAGKDDFIWAMLLHMGTNMWCDQVPDRWGPFKGEDLNIICKADHLRFDEAVWRRITRRMAEIGMNMVIIDLGEAICYPSHPELQVKGSWEVDRFRNELARLRSMGLEPIPKMNFSAGHDVWLKDYERMLSTPAYYKVCADLIRDVCEIFDHPRFLHLGYDEETAADQSRFQYCVVRQGDLWWHDFLWFVKETEKNGMRPWIWSDCYWRHPNEFLRRMPKSVLQSNWYYGTEFDVSKLENENLRKWVKAYEDIDKAGFDQVPTGSNWSCDDNFAGTVKHCRRVCSSEHLKGFMMAPWFFTLPKWEPKNLKAVDLVAEAMV